MAAKFEIRKAKDGEFYFHLKATDGEIILRSELYVAKASAKNGIASVQKNAPNEKRYERKETHNGHHMFNLRAGNHEVIGTSQGYSSVELREQGIEVVKKIAPGAEVDDLTLAAAASA